MSARAVDILVIGGGIYGATAAYEAARRGLSVLLVERGDFGGRTSSNSMKIAHGGLRYLQSFDLPRSLESIAERRRLLLIAPHLVRPLACRLDLTGRSLVYRLELRAGLRLNDLLSWRRNRGLPPASQLPDSRFPIWYDALIEDTERLLMAFLHTSKSLGREARFRNYTEVKTFERRSGRVVAARIPGEGQVEVGAVVSCRGIGESERPAVLSMNLVVDGLGLTGDGCAVALRQPEDGRNVFAVPWRRRSILGTYDRAYPHDPREPLRVEPAWIDELLAWLAPVHPELARLSRANVRFVHAGLVPASPDGVSPAHDASIRESDDGILHVDGVKWTTARGVASRAIRHAAERLGRRDAAAVSDDPLPRLLDHRIALEAYLEGNPTRCRPVLVGDPRVSQGEVLFAVDEEQARSLADVLLRRTGLAAAGHPGPALRDAVADLLQERLGWSEAERSSQVEAFDADFRFPGSWDSTQS